MRELSVLGNKFFNLLLFLLIFISVCLINEIFCSLTHLYSENKDFVYKDECKNFDVRRPRIWKLGEGFAQYATENDTRSQSIFRNKEVNSLYLEKQFNCSFNEPIHWVFHLDPERNRMNMKIDFWERKNIISIPDKDVVLADTNETITGTETRQFEYSTNFELLYFPRDLRTPMLFSCEPVHLKHHCQRNFIQVVNYNFVNDATSMPSPKLATLSESLLKSATELTTEEFSTWEECPLKLCVKSEEGNLLTYRWDTVTNTNDTKVNIKKITIPTNETTFLENLFRLKGRRETACARILEDSDICENCQRVGKVRGIPTNAVAFYATSGNFSMIFKGFYSVPLFTPTERNFYFDWEMTSKLIESEMIQLRLSNESIYATVPFTVTCRVSVFLFSYGSIITDKDFPDYSQENPSEQFNPFGYRELNRTLRLFGENESKSVSCFAPLKKSSEWIVKSVQVFVNFAEAPLIGNNSKNSTHLKEISVGTTGVSVECNTSGTPTPTLHFLTPKDLSIALLTKFQIVNGTNENSILIHFPEWKQQLFGTYVCEARNFLGVTTKTFIFTPKKSDHSSFTVPISASLGSFAVILGIIIGILAWKIRKQRQEFEIQTQKAVEEFRHGVKSDSIIVHDINFSIHQLPYNEDFEVPSSKWEIEDKILGSGQFGIVRMGSLIQKGERVKVAVKTLKSAVEIDEFKSFLFELKIMAYLGQHKNIVSLVAANTEGINERDIYIGVEFCDNGCLLDYLRRFRPSFQNMVTPDGKLVTDLSTIIGLNGSSPYANIETVTTYHIYRWSYQIASGLNYLNFRKVVHCDIAARNVLLTVRKVAKIGDFGLSRVLMNSDNYTKKSQTALPWKWMAIESLRARVFSVQSDVWAFGICLYELFTVGQSPYPGKGWSPDFINQLEAGLRMERPVFCTTSIYKIMRACWEYDPNQRPNYAKIKRKLSKGLQKLSVIVKQLHEYERNPKSLKNSSRTPSATTPPTVTPDVAIIAEEDDIGLYTNLPRGTMNYYKNY